MVREEDVAGYLAERRGRKVRERDRIQLLIARELRRERVEHLLQSGKPALEGGLCGRDSVQNLQFKSSYCNLLLLPRKLRLGASASSTSCARIQGSGFRVQGAGCRVQGSGCRVLLARKWMYLGREEDRGGGPRSRREEERRWDALLFKFDCV